MSKRVTRRSLNKLRAALRSGDYLAWQEQLHPLWQAREAALVPVLLDTLRQPNFPLHSMAAQALADLADLADKITQIEAANLLEDLLLARRPPDLYQHAADALLKLGNTGIISLLAVLKTPHPHARAAVARALAQTGYPPLDGVLIARLPDNEFNPLPERCGAALALGWLGIVAHLHYLTPLLDDPEPELRATTATALGKLGSPDAIPALLGALDDDEQAARWAAINALGEIGSEPALTALLDLLAGHANPDARRMAATRLHTVKAPGVVPALAEALGDPDHMVRAAAAQSLAHHRDAAALPALVAALPDDNARVRSDILTALGCIEDAQAIPAIVGALQDADKTVRTNAAWALGQIGGKSGIPALLAALQDDAGWVRMSAARSLGYLAPQEALDPLLAASTDPDADARMAACEALGRLGQAHEDAHEPILGALADRLHDDARALFLKGYGDSRVADVAAYWLSEIGTPAAHALLESYDAPDPLA